LHAVPTASKLDDEDDVPPLQEPSEDIVVVSAHRGDIMSKLHSLSASLFLAVWFLATPAVPADDKTGAPPAGETADRLNKLERKVADLEKDMLDLKKLPTRLEDMDKNIRESFGKIQEDIKGLSKPVQERVAKDLPDTLANGQIQLLNSWASPVLVVLDGTDYLLRPNQTRTITKRPGRFTYEVRYVDGRLIQGRKDSELRAAGRPHMIEIYSQ
jgi:hypothetical protein